MCQHLADLSVNHTCVNTVLTLNPQPCLLARFDSSHITSKRQGGGDLQASNFESARDEAGRYHAHQGWGVSAPWLGGSPAWPTRMFRTTGSGQGHCIPALQQRSLDSAANNASPNLRARAHSTACAPAHCRPAYPPTHLLTHPQTQTDDDDNDNDNDDDGEYDEELEPDLDKEEGMGGSRGGPPAGFGHGIVVFSQF